MSDLTPTPGWDAVPQLETVTFALAGPGAIMNAQAQALLNRQEYLRLGTGRVADTITALKAVDKTKHSRAFVFGYYAAGDGGGGEYLYDAADTTTADDGGGVIVATDGGRWKLNHRGSISVKQFGAKGDGTTNDAPKVQAAINFIASLGRGILVFNSGYRYLLDSQTNVCDNLTVMGYGALVLVGSSFAAPGAPLFKNFSGTSFASPGTRLASKNVAFYGLEFDGQSAGVAGTTVPDVSMRGAIICMGGWTAGTGIDGYTVKDCFMHDFAGNGVMGWGCSSVDVSENRFINFFANTSLSSGAPIDFHDLVSASVTRNNINHTASGKSWHGIVILDWNTRSQDLSVNSNVIRNLNGGDGISCEGNGADNIKNGDFSLNVILDCAGDGIGIDKCFDATVSGNTIKRAGQIGINFSGTEEITASNNTIDTAVGGGMWSNGGTTIAVLSGNKISNIAYGDATYQGDGIYLANSGTFNDNHAYTISENIIRNTGGGNIFVKGTGRHYISGNQVYNGGSSASATHKAGITSAAPGAISNNQITAGALTQYGVHPYGANLPSLHGNKFGGTFTGAKVYLSYRNNISQGASTLDFVKIEYDHVADILTTWGTASPTGSFRYAGDVHYNTAPVAGGTIGWALTTSGIPGTWKTFGAIAA